ncbi:hypothetical protein LEM8419_00872 [Neolewinella maritima]|uniref:Porin n=1 Tax=Neolewinella maritima TaxID=1383882 RepID=A0ABN8F021_9BACT|nr:outer membrane beta-barrel protein [Neolewinella maritima]CAH0999572.1 hypothetical protein LEM8419_00872 [Neolewinella maritima]
MKHLILLICLLISIGLCGQTRKGNWYLSGNTAVAGQHVTGTQTSVYSPTAELYGRSNLSATSFRSGYFLSNRLLVGTRLDYLRTIARDYYVTNESNRLSLKPFVRYYILDGSSRRSLAVFGELGFGTISFGAGDRYETDFHLGLGAELPLAPGILGTANLNYDANAWGINFTNLTLGLNVLTGQLQDSPATAPLRRGTFTTSGRLGSVAYGRNKSGDDVAAELQVRLSPQLGYFILDGLLLEAAVTFDYRTYRSDSRYRFHYAAAFDSYALDAGLTARYYVLQRGRLLPYAEVGLSYLQQRNHTGMRAVLVDGPKLRALPWRAGAGLSYILSPQLALDLSGVYQRGTTKRLRDSWTNNQPQRRLQGTVGLRFFLPAAGR